MLTPAVTVQVASPSCAGLLLLGPRAKSIGEGLRLPEIQAKTVNGNYRIAFGSD